MLYEKPMWVWKNAQYKSILVYLNNGIMISGNGHDTSPLSVIWHAIILKASLRCWQEVVVAMDTRKASQRAELVIGLEGPDGSPLLKSTADSKQTSDASPFVTLKLNLILEKAVLDVINEGGTSILIRILQTEHCGRKSDAYLDCFRICNSF